MVPMPTSPSVLGARGPSQRSGAIAAAALRMA